MFKKKIGNIRGKFRLIISDDESFEEKFITKFTMLSLFVVVGILSLCLVLGTYLLISYTSLKEYIPGYDSSELRKKGLKYFSKIDSIEKVIYLNSNYVNNLISVLKGKIAPEKIEIDSLNSKLMNKKKIDLSASKKDSIFREQIEQEEMYNLFFVNQTSNNKGYLYAPVKGIIIKEYNPTKNKYDVQVALKRKSSVKSMSNGVIVYQSLTLDLGYIVIINYKNNFTSIYKNLSAVYKKQGDIVLAGDIVGEIDKTSNNSFRLELWLDERPVNPEDFIDFDKVRSDFSIPKE